MLRRPVHKQRRQYRYRAGAWGDARGTGICTAARLRGFVLRIRCILAAPRGLLLGAALCCVASVVAGPTRPPPSGVLAMLATLPGPELERAFAPGYFFAAITYRMSKRLFRPWDEGKRPALCASSSALGVDDERPPQVAQGGWQVCPIESPFCLY